MTIGLGHWLAVAVGGSLGALARFWLVQHMNRLQAGHFPWGTFSVNVIGSFVIGLAFVFFALRYPGASGVWRSFLVVGLLGAFTTFSSFALEGLVLIQQSQYGLALLYLTGSVLTCLLAAMLGFGAGKLIF